MGTKKVTNEVGMVFDPKTASCREFDVNEIHGVVSRSGWTRSISWGFCNGTTITKNKVYRFSVNGHNHKGHVYIVLGFLDLFDIYYTDKKDMVKKVSKEVYIMDLIETLDIDIERVSEYVR